MCIKAYLQQGVTSKAPMIFFQWENVPRKVFECIGLKSKITRNTFQLVLCNFYWTWFKCNIKCTLNSETVSKAIEKKSNIFLSFEYNCFKSFYFYIMKVSKFNILNFCYTGIIIEKFHQVQYYYEAWSKGI